MPAAFSLDLLNPPLHRSFTGNVVLTMWAAVRCPAAQCPWSEAFLFWPTSNLIPSNAFQKSTIRTQFLALCQPREASPGLCVGVASVSVAVNNILPFQLSFIATTRPHDDTSVTTQACAHECTLLQLIHRWASPGHMRSCNSAQPHGNPADRSILFDGGRLHLSEPIRQPHPSPVSGSDIRLELHRLCTVFPCSRMLRFP